MLTQSDVNELILPQLRQIDKAASSLHGVVFRLRTFGVTWVAIGIALGTSPQAAQQRFGSQMAPEGDPDGPDPVTPRVFPGGVEGAVRLPFSELDEEGFPMRPPPLLPDDPPSL